MSHSIHLDCLARFLHQISSQLGFSLYIFHFYFFDFQPLIHRLIHSHIASLTVVTQVFVKSDLPKYGAAHKRCDFVNIFTSASCRNTQNEFLVQTIMCFHSWPNELKMTQDIKIEKKSLTPETDGVDYIWIFFFSFSLAHICPWLLKC